METYNCQCVEFCGRETNAIGRTYPITTIVEYPTGLRLEAKYNYIIAILYKRYECISSLIYRNDF